MLLFSIAARFLVLRLVPLNMQVVVRDFMDGRRGATGLSSCECHDRIDCFFGQPK